MAKRRAFLSAAPDRSERINICGVFLEEDRISLIASLSQQEMEKRMKE